MAYPVKNKERHEFYYSVSNPAISYYDFQQRCRNNQNKLDKQLMEELIMTPVVKNDSRIDINWRECTVCKEYKLWNMFHKAPYQCSWYNSRCMYCIKIKRLVLTDKIIYTTKSKYVSPLKVRPRKWKMMSVKDIAAMEWIHKKYCPHIRQMLYNWRDLEKMVERYKNYPQLDK